MTQCIRASRLFVVVVIGFLVWAELMATETSVGEAAEAYQSQSEPDNPSRSEGVSSRGGYRMIYGSLLEHDMLVSNPVYPLPTATPTPTPSPTPSPTPKTRLIDLGQYKITAYSDSPWLNGTDGRGITASGVKTHWGTVAVDPRLIPLWSKLVIEGFEGEIFTALDTGGGVKGNWIDIWYPSDWEAIQWGVQYRRIFLVEE
ncbi:MAG: 3D domain-containing protein [Chloroflexota bacterium]|jgi:3D (Asp-Asp-Asp) domain-containing protein